MKTLISFLALSLAAAAQTITVGPSPNLGSLGDPSKAQMISLIDGVALSGDPSAPIITNHTNRTIIAYNMKFVDVRNRGPMFTGILLYPTSAELRPGASMVGAGSFSSAFPNKDASRGLPPGLTAPMVIVGSSNYPALAAILDSVAFSDGEFVGPDKYELFEDNADKIKAMKEVALHLTQANGQTDKIAAWQYLSDLAGAKTVVHDEIQKARRAAARNFLEEKDRAGENKANELATHLVGIPDLWRAKK